MRYCVTTILLKDSRGAEQYQSMNSSMACRYPRFDSYERRLFSTADLLWSKSGNTRLPFGSCCFSDFGLLTALITAASRAAGQEPTADASVSGVSVKVFGRNWAEGRAEQDVRSRLVGCGLDHFPNDLGAHTFAPDQATPVDGPKDSPLRDRAGLGPGIDGHLHPSGGGHGANVAALADQVGDDPVVVTLLQVVCASA